MAPASLRLVMLSLGLQGFCTTYWCNKGTGLSSYLLTPHRMITQLGQERGFRVGKSSKILERGTHWDQFFYYYY